MHTQSISTDYSSALRKIHVVYSKTTEEATIANIKTFALEYGFAFRIAQKPDSSSTIILELYRSDIKLIGDWDKNNHSIDILVFPTYRELVEEAPINQGVNAFKSSIKDVKGVKIDEKILRVNSTNQDRMQSFHSLRSAEFKVPKGKHNQVRKLILEFADRNQFAIRFGKATPYADDLTISLYRDNILINIDTLLPVSEDVRVPCYQLNGPELKLETINELYNDLKNTLETIDGVNFEYTK